ISEWTAVCTHGGEQAYPYSTMFDGNACNGKEHMMTPSILAVGSVTTCQGGYPGIFDMVGNVHEWEGACYSGGTGSGQDDKCWFRGGAYEDPGEACATAYDLRRDYVDMYCDIGIRCCADY